MRDTDLEAKNARSWREAVGESASELSLPKAGSGLSRGEHTVHMGKEFLSRLSGIECGELIIQRQQSYVWNNLLQHRANRLTTQHLNTRRDNHQPGLGGLQQNGCVLDGGRS